MTHRKITDKYILNNLQYIFYSIKYHIFLLLKNIC